MNVDPNEWPAPEEGEDGYLACPQCGGRLQALNRRWPTIFCSNCTQTWQWSHYDESWQ